MKLAYLYDTPQEFYTEFGIFNLQLFYNGIEEAVVLSYGELKGENKVLVRIQTECIHHQLYRINYCDCNEQIANSLKLIKERNGILILLKSTKGYGMAAQFSPNTEDSRNYDIAIQILKEFYQVSTIDLISLNKRKMELISKHIKIDEFIWYKNRFIRFNPLLEITTERIWSKELFSPFSALSKARKVLCIGDINIDFNTINNTLDVRGSGFNSWTAFNTPEYFPILFGKIGDDANGKKVEEAIDLTLSKNSNMYAMLGIHHELPTCVVKIFPAEDNTSFYYSYDVNNANDYDIKNLEKTLKLIDFNEYDLIHIASYVFFQYHYNISKCKEFFKVISSSKAKVVIDIARYTMKKKPKDFDIYKLGECLLEAGSCHLLISDLSSIKSLLPDSNNTGQNLTNKEIAKIFDATNTKYFVCRRGDDAVKIQDIYKNLGDDYEHLKGSEHPWNDYHNREDKRGYGDKLTLIALEEISKSLN